MTANQTFERQLASWMADEVAFGPPDGAVDLALTATGRLRPRPRWLALLRQAPMKTESRVLVGSPSRRVAVALAVALLAAALVVAGAYLLANQPSPADWSGYRGGAGHAGLGRGAPVGQPVILWQYRAGGAANRGIGIAGGLVVAPTDDGIIQAIDLESGALRWSVTLASAPGGVLIVDDRIFVGGRDGVLHALDLQTGAEVWKTTEGIAEAPDLTAGDGAVYVPTAGGDLVAVDAATGAIRWRATVSSSGKSLHQPAFDGGRVYVGDDDVLVAIDAANGNIVWSAPTTGLITAAAVAAGGRAYEGVSPDESAGRLLAFDAGSGGPLWVLDEPLYSPSVDGDVGYAGSPSGVLAAIDLSNGAVQWRIQFDGLIRSPALADGLVFVAADDDQAVHAVRATDGAELWRQPVDGNMLCCLAVARGVVVVGTTSGVIYAIGGDGGSVAPQLPRTPEPSLPPSLAPPSEAPIETPIETLGPPIATLLWSTTPPDDSFVGAAVERAPDGKLWVTDPVNGRFAIFAPDGTFLEFWGEFGTRDGQFGFMSGFGDPWGAIAFADDGSFFVLDAGNRRVQAFNSDRNFLHAWGGFGTQPETFRDPVDIAVGPDGRVSVLDVRRKRVLIYDPSGTPVDSFNPLSGAPANLAGLTIDAAGNFIVDTYGPNEIRRFDPTGVPTDTFSVPEIAVGSAGTGRLAVDAAGRIFLTLGPGFGPFGALAFGSDGAFLGGWAPRGQGDGEVGFPWGIAAGDDGVVYIAEFGGDAEIPSANRLQAFKLELPPP